jgi:hypothetical protein
MDMHDSVANGGQDLSILNSACRRHTLPPIERNEDFSDRLFLAALQKSQYSLINTINSALEINNTGRQPFYVPVVQLSWQFPLATSTFATNNSFVSPVVGSHPQGELNHRTLEKLRASAVYRLPLVA